MYELIKTFLDEMNNDNSLLHKKMVLRKYQGNQIIRQILFYTYSPSINFYCTSKNVKKYAKQNGSRVINGSLFDMLEELRNRKVTGNDALKLVCNYIKTNPSEEDIVYCIIDRNLKIRVNVTTLETIFPDLFPRYFVSLANNYKEGLIENENEWFISRKLDGVRCLIFIDCQKKTVEAFSRSGKRFETLTNLENDIRNNIEKFSENTVLDGEIVMMDSAGNDDFKKIMEQITRKDFTIDTPNYQIFDMIPLQKYYKGKDDTSFELRYKKLEQILNSNFLYCHVVNQRKYSLPLFEKMWNSISTEGWEGLMLRKNCLWEGKRTNNLLKVKRMKDDEFTVVGIEKGKIRYIESGKENEKDTMSSIILNYHGTKVGSGFTMEERDYFYQNPNEILGKMVTIQFFEKTKEKLRFPVFKGIRNGT